MNVYETRRRRRTVIYVLAVLLGLPPGFTGTAFAATQRTNTLTHDATMETFRNPQFSSSASNRFLFNHGPQALVGGGGDRFTSPGATGYGGFAEPEIAWLSYEGKVEWGDRDAFLPGVGLHLSFERMWRGSVSAYDGPLGLGWEFNWNKRLFEEADSDVVFYEMGRHETYDENTGSYTSPAGRYDTLAFAAGEFTRTDKHGIAEVYEYDTDTAGTTWYRLKSLTDLNSNALTFAYDGDRNLTKVTDTLSRDTTLAYDGSDRITSVTDSASRAWLYGYDGSGNLTSVRTPTVDEAGTEDDYTSGKTTNYKYDGSNQLTEVLRPNDSATGTWKWEYDAGYVTKQTKGGQDITISYDEVNDYTEVTDREGNVVRYSWDDATRLITARRVYYDVSNSWETTFSYNGDAEVTEVVCPKGNEVEYTYDGDGNVLTVAFLENSSDASPITWIYSYASNARLSTLTDPNGNTWDFDWDGNGNLTGKTAPAVALPAGIATTDNNGNSNNDGTISESWAYNGSGQVTRHTDAVGTLTDTTYTTVNTKSAYPQHVIADSGGLNLTRTYAHDAAGHVTSVTDPESNATTYTVNDLGQVIMAVEPGSVTRKYHFDPNDRLTNSSVTNDTDVGNTLFVVDREYDQVDNLTLLIEDLDSSNRLSTSYAYDENDRLTKVTSPDGNDTEFTYDVRDLRVSATRKAASAANDAITIATYDSNGNRVSTTDPLGNITVFALDGYDRVTKTTQPEGNYVDLVYDDNGNVVSRTWKTSGGTTLAQTLFHYDEANRLYQTDRLAKKADLSTNLGDGWQNDTLWRDERGAVLEHTGDVCGCANYEHVYDAVGRQVTSKDPMGATDATRNLVLTEYDKNGNVTRTTRKERTQDSGIEADKDIVTELVYDTRDRLITRKEKLSAGVYANTIYFYGKRDQLTKVVDGEGDERRTEYNEQLWKTKEILENGASDVETQFTYDNDGMVVTYRAVNGTTGNQDTLYVYDKLGRVVTTTWPVGGSHLVTYDKASNRISTTDPNGTLTVCAYDDNNRLTSKDMTLGTDVVGTTALDFTYDAMNRMSTADMAEGVSYSSQIVWTYNTLSKQETEQQILDGYASGAGRTITYDWDVEGQKVGVTYPVSGDVVSYTRDDLDRVDVISRGGTQVVDYAFNGARIIEKAHPGSQALYTYDGYGRLTQIHHQDTSSGHTLGKHVYALDKSHQVTSQDKLYYDDVQNTRLTSEARDLGDQYGYDGAKRLVTVLRGVGSGFLGNALYDNLTDGRYIDFAEYDYDQTGNRMTRRIDGSDDVIYAYDAANQLTDEGGVTRTFNSNGTFASRSDTSEVWKYSHTDQLAYYDSAASATFTWHFDALGRRIGRERSGGAGAGDTRTYYDGLHEIEVVGWNGSTESQSRKVVFGETMDEVLEHTDVTADPDDVYYAHSDMLGSLQIMVDDSGAIAESYRYREFGDGHVVVDSSFSYTAGAASAFLNGSRYTGRDWMGVVGSVSDPWYHYRARAYRADAGRFVQRDGVEFSGEKKNSYPYVLNQPIGMTDPTGHVAFGPGITTPTIDRIGFFPGFIGPGLIHGQALPPASGPMHTGPLNVLSLKTIGSCLPLAFSVTVRTDCPVGQCHCAYKPSTPFAQNPKVTVDAPGFWSCVVNTSASGSYLLPGGPACPAGFACGCADMLVTCTGQSVCAGQQQQVLFKWTSCNPDQLTVPWQTGDAPVIDLTPFGQC